MAKAIRTVQVNDETTIFAVLSETEDTVERSNKKADKLIEKALKAGDQVTENNITQWINSYPECDHSKSGADVYTWDKTGDRVKVNRVLVTVENGIRTEKNLRAVYRNFGDAI